MQFRTQGKYIRAALPQSTDRNSPGYNRMQSTYRNNFNLLYQKVQQYNIFSGQKMAVSPRFELELSGPKPLVLPLHHETALIQIQLHTVAQEYGKSSVYADFFIFSRRVSRKNIRLPKSDRWRKNKSYPEAVCSWDLFSESFPELRCIFRNGYS